MEQVCQVRYTILKKRLLNVLHRERLDSFKTKNRKLAALIAKQGDSYKSSTCSTPLINLSSIELTSDEINQFKFGLHCSFVDESKNIKKHLPTKFESLAEKITENIGSHKREYFHEFFRAYVDIFTKNVYATTDYTYKHLKRIIKDPNLVVVSGDKESCVVIMNKSDYQNKLQQIINDAISDGVYKVTADNTLDDLKTCTSFLYRKFYGKYEHYEKILLISNQPGQLYGTAKTHKFSSIEDITLENLKFRPIIAQSGTYTYNAAQVIADYLKPLCSDNDYIIRNTQEFPKLLQQQDPLLPNEE